MDISVTQIGLAGALVACLVTLIATPFTIYLAKRYGLVDDPTKRPHPAHVHHRIVPRAGGLAIYLGIITAASFFLPVDKHLMGIFVGMTILLAMGLLDDKLTNFSPYIRLPLLFLAALAPVASGVGISFISNPLTGYAIFPQPYIRLDEIIIPFDFLGPHRIIPFADLLAFFWIVTLTQIINWSKGVDGQMPGITFISALTLGLLSMKLYFGGDLDQLNVAKLGFIVAGTSLGFLIFNWHPAKIFPGFSGSTILAFMLAVLSILSGAKLATALLVLAVPSIDFIYTIFRRVSKGKSPVWGDRGHLHHRLLDLGWSHQAIALFYLVGSAILGVIAVVVDTQSKFFFALGVATIFFAFILWINSFGDLSEKSDLGNG